jgi:hypothetical protein
MTKIIKQTYLYTYELNDGYRGEFEMSEWVSNDQAMRICKIINEEDGASVSHCSFHSRGRIFDDNTQERVRDPEPDSFDKMDALTA